MTETIQEHIDYMFKKRDRSVREFKKLMQREGNFSDFEKPKFKPIRFIPKKNKTVSENIEPENIGDRSQEHINIHFPQGRCQDDFIQ